MASSSFTLSNENANLTSTISGPSAGLSTMTMSSQWMKTFGLGAARSSENISGENLTSSALDVEAAAATTINSGKLGRLPRVIPPRYVVDSRKEWDRKGVCEAAALQGMEKLAQIALNLKRQIPGLEEQQLTALRQKNKPQMKALDEAIQQLYNQQSRANQLLKSLPTKNPTFFTDKFLEMLQSLTEESLATDEILLEGDKLREPIFDLRQVIAQAPQTIDLKLRIRCMCTDPEEPSVVYMGLDNGSVSVWNIETLKEVATYSCGVYPILSVSIGMLSGRKRLLTSGMDKTVRVWDIATHECEHLFTTHVGYVSSVFACDGALFTASLDRRVYCWDLLRNRVSLTVLQATSAVHCAMAMEKVAPSSNHGPPSGEGTADPDSAGGADPNSNSERSVKSVLIAGLRNGDIQLHDLDEKSHSVIEGSETVLRGHTQAVRCFHLHAGDFLLSGSYASVIQWDLRTMKLARTFRRHVDSVVSIRTTVDSIMFTASQDALIMLWSLNDGSFLSELHHHYHHVTCLEMVMLPQPSPPAEARRPSRDDSESDFSSSGKGDAAYATDSGQLTQSDVDQRSESESTPSAAAPGQEQQQQSDNTTNHASLRPRSSEGRKKKKGKSSASNAPSSSVYLPFLLSGSCDKTCTLWALTTKDHSSNPPPAEQVAVQTEGRGET